jgi:hypothetical protein
MKQQSIFAVAAAFTLGALASRAGAADAASEPTPAASTSASTRSIEERDAPPKHEPNAPTSVAGSASTAASAPPAPSASPPSSGAPESHEHGFSFGSYGRVNVASDLRGGSGRQANIVYYGTRIDLPTYAELQLERYDHFKVQGDDLRTNVVATLGIAGPLFHETGDFSANIAVRNLYVEAKGLWFSGFSAWVGSRMYRGDDIYLLNWWPLDNLNTVGGGVRLAFDTTSKEATSLALHVGLGRANDPFSFQERPSPAPSGFGASTVITLDRPRMIVSAKLAHVELLGGGPGGFKGVLYAEQHSISSGTYVDADNVSQSLPTDSGTVIGAQLGAFTGVRDVFVNLFVRYATGIAAYGDKTVPTALAPDNSTRGAHEALAAIGANYETGPFAVLLGGYVRGFQDASGATYSVNTYNEGTIVVRPTVWPSRYAGVSVEGSYQFLSTAAFDAEGRAVGGRVFRLGVLPFITPFGRGSFTRPHLQLIYVATFRDAAAQRLYAPDDAFYSRSVEHFLGIGAEWWFNSSYR